MMARKLSQNISCGGVPGSCWHGLCSFPLTEQRCCDALRNVLGSSIQEDVTLAPTLISTEGRSLFQQDNSP